MSQRMYTYSFSVALSVSYFLWQLKYKTGSVALPLQGCCGFYKIHIFNQPDSELIITSHPFTLCSQLLKLSKANKSIWDALHMPHRRTQKCSSCVIFLSPTSLLVGYLSIQYSILSLNSPLLPFR